MKEFPYQENILTNFNIHKYKVLAPRLQHLLKSNQYDENNKTYFGIYGARYYSNKRFCTAYKHRILH